VEGNKVYAIYALENQVLARKRVEQARVNYVFYSLEYLRVLCTSIQHTPYRYK
jgi:hypothetical protein